MFSKQARFIPCKGHPSAQRLADFFLKNIYHLHGVPRRIISDRGVQFTAHFWKEFIQIIGSSQVLSTEYPIDESSLVRNIDITTPWLLCIYHRRNPMRIGGALVGGAHVGLTVEVQHL
ncbi:hypothetical protein E2320_003491, partial [Naja naja]